MKDKWIDLGDFTNGAINSLREARSIYKSVHSDKSTFRKLNKIIKDLEDFKSSAENDMFNNGYEDFNVFYGEGSLTKEVALNTFISERLITCKGNELHFSEIFKCYLEWCDYHKFESVAKTIFGTELSKVYKKKKSGVIIYLDIGVIT